MCGHFWPIGKLWIDQKIVFERYVVRCAYRNASVSKFGLHAQKVLITLGSTFHIIGEFI